MAGRSCDPVPDRPGWVCGGRQVAAGGHQEQRDHVSLDGRRPLGAASKAATTGPWDQSGSSVPGRLPVRARPTQTWLRAGKAIPTVGGSSSGPAVLPSPPPSQGQAYCSDPKVRFCDPAVASEHNDRGVSEGRPLVPPERGPTGAVRDLCLWGGGTSGGCVPCSSLSALPFSAPPPRFHRRPLGRPLPWGVDS